MSVLWIGIWLIPLISVGSARHSVRIFPRYLRDLQSIACLFPDAVTGWSTYHAEVQASGDLGWREVDLEDYFQVEIFGYRTQVSRMLSNSFGQRDGHLQLREIAEYIRERNADRDPAAEKLVAVRFARARHPIADLAAQEGRFKNRPLDAIPWAQVIRFGEIRFDGGRPELDSRGRRFRSKNL